MTFSNPPKKIKEKLYKRAKNKCEECGSIKNLEIHHTKRMLSFRTIKEINHNLNNLRLLCHECHLKIKKGIYLKSA